jgi:hypothetical protein
MEDKDHTEGLKEGDNIMQALLDMHEDVPLGDPGPKIVSEDGEQGVGGDVPLKDPGPKTVNEHGGEGAAGETQ